MIIAEHVVRHQNVVIGRVQEVQMVAGVRFVAHRGGRMDGKVCGVYTSLREAELSVAMHYGLAEGLLRRWRIACRWASAGLLIDAIMKRVENDPHFRSEFVLRTAERLVNVANGDSNGTSDEAN